MEYTPDTIHIPLVLEGIPAAKDCPATIESMTHIYRQRSFMRIRHDDGTITDGNGNPIGTSADRLFIAGIKEPTTAIGGVRLEQ